MIVCLIQVHPDFLPPQVSSFFSFISFFSESQSELAYLQEVRPVILLPHKTSSAPSLVTSRFRSTRPDELHGSRSHQRFSSHAVPALTRCVLRADARAARSPDALLHRGHSRQKRVRAWPGGAHADPAVSKLVVHQPDPILPDPDLRAHADPPGSVAAGARVRVHLPVPARLYARADPPRPAG